MFTDRLPLQRHPARHAPRPATRWAAPRIVAVSAAALLALAGCSGPGGSPAASDSGSAAAASSTSPGPASSGPTTQASSATATGSSERTGSSGSSGSAAGSGAAGADNAGPAVSLEDAAATALKQVPGTTLISIETESSQSRWEVQLVNADGEEYEVTVSADDGKVPGSPRPEHEDAQDRQKHKDRVAAATVDYREAATAFRQAVPNAHIIELNLDTERGMTVWKGDLEDANGTKHSVAIDAGTGDVITNSLDADD